MDARACGTDEHGGGLAYNIRCGNAEFSRLLEGFSGRRQGKTGQQRADGRQYDLVANVPAQPLHRGHPGQGLGRSARQQRAPETHEGERGGGQGPAHAAGTHFRDRSRLLLAWH